MKINARNQFPVIALSVHWHMCPTRLEWAVAQGFAIEYSPNPRAFDLLPVHLAPAIEADVPVRHHGFFPRHEFAHVDTAVAEQAVRVHISALEALHGLGEQVITVHIGLDPKTPLDPGRAVANLSHIVARAEGLGITVCLENLRRGPTSDPETVLAWARESGAMITLDVGHAVSCQRVQSGELSPIDFVDTFEDRLLEVHMYERETDRHYPPRDMSVLGPIVDRLLTTSCGWWTIELGDDDEALATRALLIDYVQADQR
jgi:sugar phosphate isomerase/epimerase